MVDSRILLDLPHIVCHEEVEGPHSSAPFQNPPKHWRGWHYNPMANEDFENGYPDAASPYSNHPSMQRFLQVDGPYSANRPIFDLKQPQFSGNLQESVSLEYCGSASPWPNDINMAHDPWPQESWSSGWPSLDQESCSGATGNTWSPQATESCSDYDPRYPTWTASQPLVSPYSYSGYSNGFAHGAGATSPPSYTGTLSKIQQHPDTEVEDGSLEEEMHVSDRVYPAIAARLDPGAAGFNHDEGLGSSVHGSAIASPSTEDENMAMESNNGDSDNGSDYSPRTRSKQALKSRKARTNLRCQGSISPTVRRLSSAKSTPHQLTQPAGIIKRLSSSKPSIATHSHTSPPASNPAYTVRCTYPQCIQSFPSTPTLSKHVLSAHTRPFVCSFARYGCKSTFGSKNEWKRHNSSIHLRLGIYRCDIGTCAAPRAGGARSRNTPSSTSGNAQQSGSGGCGYNSNRKDLFTQHLNRMHRPDNSAPRAERDGFENTLEAVRQRCWVRLREPPPRSSCGYCAPHPSRQHSSSSVLSPVPSSNHNTTDVTKTKPTKPTFFTGPGSWDERMEHIGRHLEKGDPGEEVEDLELREWMLQEGLLTYVKGEYRVVGVGGKRRGRGAKTGGIREDEALVGEVMGEEDADGEDE